MNLIMANDQILPCLTITFTTDAILLFALIKTIIIMLNEEVGTIREIFNVTRLIQEAKMTIRKWIKSRENSEMSFKEKTIINTINNRTSYWPRYHTWQKKEKQPRIGIKITTTRINTIHANVALLDK